MRVRILVAALLFLLSGQAGLAAAQAVPSGSSTTAGPQTAQPAPAPPDQGPVAVPEATPKAMARYRSGIVLWIADTIWGFVLPALVLFSGLSARMRDWATRLGRSSAGTVEGLALQVRL